MQATENTPNLAAFIREHRSNETNFEKLYAKFEQEATQLPTADAIKTKADVYRQAKEATGTAWPGFEGFVTELERAVLQAKP